MVCHCDLGRPNHDTAGRLDKGEEEVEDAGGKTESEQLREISPPSSFVECEQEVEDAGGRTPGLQSEAPPCRRHPSLQSDLSPPTPQKLLGRRKSMFHKCVVPVDARKVDLTWLIVIA
ncbi:hypothetical protein Scep_006610 [Stephania cephalantha]|uniref:Uncharacterized protein n=1 Tax=Stephania cephalantha TaxID=152367 RepID=A0AAP0K882_9MAGN